MRSFLFEPSSTALENTRNSWCAPYPRAKTFTIMIFQEVSSPHARG